MCGQSWLTTTRISARRPTYSPPTNQTITRPSKNMKNHLCLKEKTWKTIERKAVELKTYSDWSSLRQTPVSDWAPATKQRMVTKMGLIMLSLSCNLKKSVRHGTYLEIEFKRFNRLKKIKWLLRKLYLASDFSLRSMIMTSWIALDSNNYCSSCTVFFIFF